MIVRLICGVIFGALAAVAAQAADGQLRDDDLVPPYNYNLAGVTSVVYGLVFSDRLFLADDNDCQIDWKAWHTAIDFVANQSNKLKFVKFEEHRRMSKELEAKRDELFKEYVKESDRAKGPEFQKPKEAYEKAWHEAHIFNFMPRLNFIITVAKIENTCVADVKADVSAATEDTKFIATGVKPVSSSMEMWSSGSFLKAPKGGISEFVISTSETIMKEFIDKWTLGSCLTTTPGPGYLVCKP
jgi:hypothetical protein